MRYSAHEIAIISINQENAMLFCWFDNFKDGFL